MENYLRSHEESSFRLVKNIKRLFLITIMIMMQRLIVTKNICLKSEMQNRLIELHTMFVVTGFSVPSCIAIA